VQTETNESTKQVKCWSKCSFEQHLCPFICWD